ncbi:hypothetical protein AB0F42_24340 [Streptomyces buecherae]|uniref:hypothetical protein n=1 Tax=Streptomyces buecherae TaxID=2763006 RepID=UPI0033D98A8A
MTRPPIAGADVWLPVMDAAGHRCQCTGACGSKHTDRKSGKPGRCPLANGDHVSRIGEIKLIAAPADVATSSPPTSTPLLAWCRPCYDGARRIARRVVKQAPPQEDALFATEEYRVAPASKRQAEVGRA